MGELERQAENVSNRFNVVFDIPIMDGNDIISKARNSRIVYISAPSAKTVKIMCEVYKQSAFYPTYAYIILNIFPSDLTKLASITDCTSSQVATALEGVFFLRYRLRNSVKTKLISNLTWEENY